MEIGKLFLMYWCYWECTYWPLVDSHSRCINRKLPIVLHAQLCSSSRIHQYHFFFLPLDMFLVDYGHLSLNSEGFINPVMLHHLYQHNVHYHVDDLQCLWYNFQTLSGQQWLLVSLHQMTKEWRANKLCN